MDVPEIKLIRTDTTLDLSQKAEKVCFWVGPAGRIIATTLSKVLLQHRPPPAGRGPRSKAASSADRIFGSYRGQWHSRPFTSNNAVKQCSQHGVETYKFFQNWLRVPGHGPRRPYYAADFVETVAAAPHPGHHRRKSQKQSEIRGGPPK